MNRIFTLSLIVCSLTSLAQSPRTVLLETSESTQLPSTAEIICAKEEARTAFFNDIAIISYHPDNVINGGDPLFSTISNNWASELGVNQLSRGAIDRVSYDSTSITELGTDVWQDTIAARINRPAPGLVTLPEVLIDPATDEMFVRVQLNVTEDVIELEEYRFFLYITEDGQEADQLVDVGANLCTVLPDTNDTSYNFPHQDVPIGNPSGVDGTDNIIPGDLTDGSQYTWSYTYNVPSSKSLDDLRVVGFVAAWSGEADITRNYLINAATANAFTEYDSSDPSDPNHPENPENPNSIFNPDNWPTGLEERIEMQPSRFYPNPMEGLGILEFTVPTTQQVQVDLFDLNGRLVQQVYNQKLSAGPQKAAISGSDLQPGVYHLSVNGENFNLVERVIVK